MIKVKSVVKMNFPRIRQLEQAQVTALEQTVEALHTEVVQAQVMPFKTGALQNETIQRVGRGKSASYPIHRMPGGCISTRSTISRPKKIPMHGENGMRTGFPAARNLILLSILIRESTGGW